MLSEVKQHVAAHLINLLLVVEGTINSGNTGLFSIKFIHERANNYNALMLSEIRQNDNELLKARESSFVV